VADAEGDAILGRLEIEEIRAGMRAGLRGPVLINWVERLLQDRDARDRALLEALRAIEGRGGAPARRVPGRPLQVRVRGEQEGSEWVAEVPRAGFYPAASTDGREGSGRALVQVLDVPDRDQDCLARRAAEVRRNPDGAPVLVASPAVDALALGDPGDVVWVVLGQLRTRAAPAMRGQLIGGSKVPAAVGAALHARFIARPPGALLGSCVLSPRSPAWRVQAGPTPR
jgi:hypothetical protein